MIKCEIEERCGVVRLTFVSNNGDSENDILDRIGNAILSKAPKRGSYLGRSMVIDVRKPEDL